MWFQGVDYKANIAGIVQQVITQSTEGITEAMRLFAEAHSKCPDSAIVAGGYRYVTCLYDYLPKRALLT